MKFQPDFFLFKQQTLVRANPKSSLTWAEVINDKSAVTLLVDSCFMFGASTSLKCVYLLSWIKAREKVTIVL